MLVADQEGVHRRWQLLVGSLENRTFSKALELAKAIEEFVTIERTGGGWGGEGASALKRYH